MGNKIRYTFMKLPLKIMLQKDFLMLKDFSKNNLQQNRTIRDLSKIPTKKKFLRHPHPWFRSFIFDDFPSTTQFLY